MHSISAIMYMCISSSGAGVGEGDTYQRVNVDDGSTAEGTVDHLVCQTVPLSLNHLCSGHTTPEGIYKMYIYIHPCIRIHIHTCNIIPYSG